MARDCANPALRDDAVADQPHAAVTVSGSTSTSTVDRDKGFAGAAVVAVTASGGRGGTDTKAFTLQVTGG